MTVGSEADLWFERIPVQRGGGTFAWPVVTVHLLSHLQRGSEEVFQGYSFVFKQLLFH